MKKLAILSLTLISVTALSAQKLDNKEVPAVIKAAFQKQYPTITDVDWEKEKVETKKNKSEKVNIFICCISIKTKNPDGNVRVL